jgi:hypothetical protein
MVTTVKMDCKALGVVGREFTVDHATALLQYQDKRQVRQENRWLLSEGYSYENGVISPTSNRKAKGTSEQSGVARRSEP